MSHVSRSINQVSRSKEIRPLDTLSVCYWDVKQTNNYHSNAPLTYKRNLHYPLSSHLTSNSQANRTVISTTNQPTNNKLPAGSDFREIELCLQHQCDLSKPSPVHKRKAPTDSAWMDGLRAQTHSPVRCPVSIIHGSICSCRPPLHAVMYGR